MIAVHHTRSWPRLLVVPALILLLVMLFPLTGASASNGATCKGQPATIVGTPGPDNLVGTDGDDVILGLRERDTIDGKGGNDLICGGGGKDTIYGGPGDDRLYGGPRDDTISGGPGNDSLFGHKGDDHLIGGEGIDTCRGGKGDNVIESCGGAVTLIANGSFEEGTTGKVGVGSDAITSWSVDAGDVDYINGFWVSSDGARSIDINGGAAGTISQTFTTVAGHKYKVTFDVAGAAFNPTTVQASAAGKSKDFAFDATFRPLDDLGWAAKSFKFTAVGPTSTLTFKSLTAGFAGNPIDNIKVVDLGG